MVPWLLPFTDHAAGDFLSGIAGWLSVEIVGIAVNDYGPSDYLMHRKAVGSKGQICISLALHEWRQVTGMFRMGMSCGIIMAFGSGETGAGTCSALMNMKPEKAGMVFLWKSKNSCLNENASIFLKKLNAPG